LASDLVSWDWRVEDGVRFCVGLGRFDEISTGYGWSGLGAFHYIWNDLPASASTPQVVLAARYLALPKQRGEIYALQDEQMILRNVRFFEIERWANANTPVSLPALESVPTGDGPAIRILEDILPAASVILSPLMRLR
jgi:hypothetical protein